MSAAFTEVERLVEPDAVQTARRRWPEGAARKSKPIPATLRPALLEELIFERMQLERQLVELIDFELQLDDSIGRLLDQLDGEHEIGALIRTCFERARDRVHEQTAEACRRGP